MSDHAKEANLVQFLRSSWLIRFGILFYLHLFIDHTQMKFLSQWHFAHESAR